MSHNFLCKLDLDPPQHNYGKSKTLSELEGDGSVQTLQSF